MHAVYDSILKLLKLSGLSNAEVVSVIAWILISIDFSTPETQDTRNDKP